MGGKWQGSCDVLVGAGMRQEWDQVNVRWICSNQGWKTVGEEVGHSAHLGQPAGWAVGWIQELLLAGLSHRVGSVGRKREGGG